MKTLGYYNGNINELEKSTVPMLDRACYFGDGVFNVTYARNRKPYELGLHIDQFFKSAELLRITPNFSKEYLSSLICELCKKLDDTDLWIYFQLTRASAERMHAFSGGEPNLWIMIKPAKIRDIHETVRCITAEDKRHAYCNIKTLNYVPNVLAAQEAVDKGVDECIMVRDGIVTECVHANLGILSNGAVITHPADEWIYAGCGRRVLLDMCKKLGVPFEERYFDVDEMLRADEIFRISGSSLCMQIVEVDGKSVGGKDTKTLKLLQESLLDKFIKETD